MSSKKVVLSSIAIGLLISAFLVVFLLRTSAHRAAAAANNNNGSHVVSPEPETIEQPLPETQLTDLEGHEIPSDQLRQGRYLLVFLTSSCGPCVDEANAISRIVQDSPAPLRVYGVGVERPAQVATFIKEFDLKFPFLIDKGSGLKQALNIHRFPTKLLVENGTVKKAWYGKTVDQAMLHGELALVEVK